MTSRMTDGNGDEVRRARHQWHGAKLADDGLEEAVKKHDAEMRAKWDAIRSMAKFSPKTLEEVAVRKISDENFVAAESIITQAEQRESSNQRDGSRIPGIDYLIFRAQLVLEAQKQSLFARRGGMFF